MKVLFKLPEEPHLKPFTVTSDDCLQPLGPLNTGDNKKVINIHEPLLLFLSLWRCLAVRIYWDFCLEQVMTGPHKTGRGGAQGEGQRAREEERKTEGRWQVVGGEKSKREEKEKSRL